MGCNLRTRTFYDPYYDTMLVIANTATFAGRTNVTKIREKLYDSTSPHGSIPIVDTMYYGYDSSGDFYIYDTSYQSAGWHRYPTGSRLAAMEQFDSMQLGTTLSFGYTSNARYTGTGSVTVGAQPIPTENVSERSTQNLRQIDSYIDLRYGSSIKFYAELIDTVNNLQAVGVGVTNPIIYTHALKSSSLK